MTEVPQIYYWKGILLSELPREELEQALIETWERLERLQTAFCERSVAHVRDLAEMAKRK